MIRRTLFAALLFAGCHTPKSATPDAATSVDPCAKVTCEMGTHCEVREGRAECAPDPDENPCNVTACAGEQVCVVEGGKATCVSGSDESEDEAKADAGGSTAPARCATMLCPPKTICDDLPSGARCVPLPSCDGTTCPEGQRCELKEVQCIRAPCPAQPRCVP